MQSLYTRLLLCLAIYDCIYSGTNAKSDIDIIQPIYCIFVEGIHIPTWPTKIL